MARNYVDNIPNTAKKIKNSEDYIDIDGSVYTYLLNTNKVIKKTLQEKQGYMYGPIHNTKDKRCHYRRIHRVVAETFIPNPEGLPVVGHRNNIKTDNRVENLYWTTYSENTKKAVNDKLLVNDKGFDDSQSKPVCMYETTTNKLLGVFGSISEAVRKTGLPKTTICRQAKYHRPVRKPYYFRYIDDEAVTLNEIVAKRSYETDEIIELYFNIGDAARQNNACEKTISQQCKRGKPKTKFSNYYYGIINSKCEQTIESPIGE